MNQQIVENKITQQQGIQILRGIAALMIVIGHSLSRVRGASSALFNQELDIYLPTGFGVDLFFVISGFIIFISSERLRNRDGARLVFIKRRLIRIVPIYWISTTLWVGITFGKDFLKSGAGLDWYYIAASYFFIPFRTLDDLRPTVFPVYDLGWTLNYEMYFYAIFSIFLFRSKYLSVFLIFLSMISMVLVGTFIDSNSVQFTFWSQPIVFEFLFGIVIGIFYTKGFAIPGKLTVPLILLAVAFVAAHPYGLPVMINGTQLNGYSRFLLWGLAAVCIVFATALGPHFKTSWLMRRFVYLGDASYSIYLFHPFGLFIVSAIFKRFVPPSDNYLVYFFIALFFVALSVALLFYRFVENPLTNTLKARLSTQ